jgi:tRNA (guanine37-N1)-methyltransferase
MVMRFDVITLFPEVFSAITESGITARARKRGLWNVHFWNPRDVTQDLHRTVDDRPFGGGPGMVMMAEPLAQTLEMIRKAGNHGPVFAFAPNGERLTDQRVRAISSVPRSELVLVCGRYEGIDERFLQTFVDEQISLGDFVLSGAELAACCLMDAVIRQLPGAIKDLSSLDESFATGLLDAPHYTRPEVWRGQPVPEVLLSGHHANIAQWTREKSLEKTFQSRPDMIKIARSLGQLSKKDEAYLEKLS